MVSKIPLILLKLLILSSAARITMCSSSTTPEVVIFSSLELASIFYSAKILGRSTSFQYLIQLCYSHKLSLSLILFATTFRSSSYYVSHNSGTSQISSQVDIIERYKCLLRNLPHSHKASKCEYEFHQRFRERSEVGKLINCDFMVSLSGELGMGMQLEHTDYKTTATARVYLHVDSWLT